MQALLLLNLDFNDIKDDGIQELASALENNQVKYTTFHNVVRE